MDNDLVGEKKVNKDWIQIKYVPEYLIILDKFLEIAAEYGLAFEPENSLNFHDFYAKKI